MQSQQLQRKEKQALASNVSTTSAPSSRKAKSQGQGADSQSVGSQSPTPATIPLRPLRPSIPTTAFDTAQPYPFSAPVPTDQMFMDSCTYPTSNPGHFQVPNAVAGVAFIDGSLTVPDTSCLSLNTAAPGPQPTSAPYVNVPGAGVFTDYSLGPFTTAGHSNGYADAVPAWASPTMSAATQTSDDTTTLVQQQQQQSPVRKRRRTLSPARCIVGGPSSPPPSLDIWSGNRLARMTNGNMIGETMMRIYHDVMEGALSCWLTEQTCPYNSLPANLGNRQQQFWGTFEDMQREWGSDWSNRIYRRVIKLDRLSHLLGLKRLSHVDDRKVSSALNASVMAFTAQWAQASQRSQARWPPVVDLNGEHIFRPPDLDIGEEFDRTLQKSFWNQARKSLDDCSEIDSFRVVFAEIIFGLTQKYDESFEGQQHDKDRGTSEIVEDILRQDMQQIWLERATRRLHVLRRRVELYDRQMRNKQDGDHSCYDAECRKTIDLLFWLVVMFDTISAAMTERPLTVSDEDSSNLALTHPLQHNRTPGPVGGDTAKRWNVILAKDQQTKLASLRWPCGDQSIAQELTDAAPVKVLLYRKVTRLQTLIARDTDDPATIEAAIADSLMVYAHWQAIYGPLFSDCIEHHVLLSPRIQSWYVCLFGHWLLATLLLVDLIEMVDQRGLGDATEAARRTEARQAAGIRRSTVQLISELAKASTPRHDEYGELDNFHHAVSEGALLTEPWTMILIRTFSRASIILLEDGEEPVARVQQANGGKGERGNFERCMDCVKALWYLGRKSDMAREVATVLGAALQRAGLRAPPVSNDVTI